MAATDAAGQDAALWSWARPSAARSPDANASAGHVIGHTAARAVEGRRPESGGDGHDGHIAHPRVTFERVHADPPVASLRRHVGADDAGTVSRGRPPRHGFACERHLKPADGQGVRVRGTYVFVVNGDDRSNRRRPRRPLRKLGVRYRNISLRRDIFDPWSSSVWYPTFCRLNGESPDLRKSLSDGRSVAKGARNSSRAGETPSDSWQCTSPAAARDVESTVRNAEKLRYLFLRIACRSDGANEIVD